MKESMTLAQKIRSIAHQLRRGNDPLGSDFDLIYNELEPLLEEVIRLQAQAEYLRKMYDDLKKREILKYD